MTVLVGLGASYGMWRRRQRRTPEETLVHAWERVETALDRTRFARPPSRTPSNHARLIRVSTPGDDLGSVIDDIERLAVRLERCAYAGELVRPSDADEAQQTSRKIARALRNGANVE